jgi:hypothetical protein
MDLWFELRSVDATVFAASALVVEGTMAGGMIHFGVVRSMYQLVGPVAGRRSLSSGSQATAGGWDRGDRFESE